MYNDRVLYLIWTNSLVEAQEIIKSKYFVTEYTTIDTTKDFNQNKWLGQEFSDTLIFIDHKTKINGILSIIGCVCGGARLFLVFKHEKYNHFFRLFFIPKLQKISEKNISTILANKDTTTIYDNGLLSKINEAVKKINGGVLHVIGQRGTGKSTLLGLYIRQVCKNSNKYVILLSPSRKSSVNTLKYLTDYFYKNFNFLSSTNSFNLIDSKKASHIIIDEAASINSVLLKKIKELSNNTVIILATTIDGYEGTGQSYRISYVNNKIDQVIHLTEPKRFSPQDRLYQLSQLICHPNKFYKNWVDLADGIKILAADEMLKYGLIIPVFALLQSSHYKTTPNDLANFYNNKALFIVCIKEKKIIGAAYALPESLADIIDKSVLIIDIINGSRRVKNAMTHQAIINAYGEDSIAKKKILRISRIAVVESQRRQGIATSILTDLEYFAKSNGTDFISTSFSAQQDTLSFWLAQKFNLVRIGINKNKWHGSFSLLLLKDLSGNDSIISVLQKKFIIHYRYYLVYKQQNEKVITLLNQYIHLILKKNNIIDNTMPNKQQLIRAINSVVLYHRDINWILPEIDAWLEINAVPDKLGIALKSILTGCFIGKQSKRNARKILFLLKAYLTR